MKSPVKTAVVCFPGRSGLAQYSYSLCNGLSAYFDNLYFVTNRELEFPEENLSCRVVKLFGRSRELIFQYPRFIFFILKENIKIIHFQSWIKFLYIDFCIIFFFKLLGKKVVFTAHDVLPMGERNNHKFLIGLLYGMVDHVIVHSENSKNLIVKMTRSCERRISVIPHGVYDIFLPFQPIDQQSARNALGIRKQTKIILFFGTINERKGVRNLIIEFGKLVHADSSIFLVIAGKNCYPLGILENLIEKIGLANNLLIIDKWLLHKDVQLCFTSADVVVLPYKESFTSGVLKLAYAFRKPLIATRIGELPEIINEEMTGILVNENLNEEDVQRIINFINNPNSLEIARRNIEHIVDKKYSWSKIAYATASVYRKCLNEVI